MSKNTNSQVGGQRGRQYPIYTLEESLKVAQALKDNNGGNPWPSSEVATAINSKSKSSVFYYQTSAAQMYGLTKGTRNTPQISLQDLGRDIIYAPNPEKELEKKREAFFNVKLFKDVLDHYKGSRLPEIKYLGNTLENKFNLPPSQHEEFIEIFKKNAKYLGLESEEDFLQSRSGKNDKQSPETKETQTVVISEPKQGGNTGEIFVIMPFGVRTDDYYIGFFGEVLSSLITPAAAELGFKIRTARKTGSDVIQSTIINALISADLVIADLTEHNPNVLFELGVRMALEKPVLLIRAEGTEKIFDVDNMLRVFDYKPMLWPSTLKDDVPELVKYIKATKESKDKTYMQILGSNESK